MVPIMISMVLFIYNPMSTSLMDPFCCWRRRTDSPFFLARPMVALSGGKVMAGSKLVAALVAGGANKGTATQFLYSKAGKQLLKRTDDGWLLKG